MPGAVLTWTVRPAKVMIADGNRAKGLWLNLRQSLGFVPGVIVAVFTVLGVVLVELDGAIDLEGTALVFGATARRPGPCSR